MIRQNNIYQKRTGQNVGASMYDYIKTVIPGERILFHQQMKEYTTFRVGGEAKCMIMIQQEEELAKLIPYLNQIEQDYFILGNGSNLLVGDKGYCGVVLKFDGPMEHIAVEGTRIIAKAGALIAISVVLSFNADSICFASFGIVGVVPVVGLSKALSLE